MTDHGHFKQVCRQCRATIAQCRCFDANKTIRFVEQCEACQAKAVEASPPAPVQAVGEPVIGGSPGSLNATICNHIGWIERSDMPQDVKDGLIGLARILLEVEIRGLPKVQGLPVPEVTS